MCYEPVPFLLPSRALWHLHNSLRRFLFSIRAGSKGNSQAQRCPAPIPAPRRAVSSVRHGPTRGCKQGGALSALPTAGRPPPRRGPALPGPELHWPACGGGSPGSRGLLMAAAARSLPAPPGPGPRRALMRRWLLPAAEGAGPGAAARSWEGGSCPREGQECGGTIVPRPRGPEGWERKDRRRCTSASGARCTAGRRRPLGWCAALGGWREVSVGGDSLWGLAVCPQLLRVVGRVLSAAAVTWGGGLLSAFPPGRAWPGLAWRLGRPRAARGGRAGPCVGSAAFSQAEHRGRRLCSSVWSERWGLCSREKITACSQRLTAKQLVGCFLSLLLFLFLIPGVEPQRCSHVDRSAH